MRKNCYLFLLPVLLLFFSACQKEQSQKTSTGLSVVEMKTKVTAWLDKQKSVSTPKRNSKIQSLEENLDFSGLSIEPLNEQEQLVVIPLTAAYKTTANKDNNPVSNLVVILSKDGTIDKGNVIQYVAGNGKTGILQPNVFSKIFNKLKLTSNSRFTILDLMGRYLYELAFENGKLHSAKALTPKASTTNTNSKVNGTCTEWYLVTTIYYTDGTTETYESYLGTTCNGCSASSPNTLCDAPVEDPGGGNEDCSNALNSLSGSVVAETGSISTIEETENSRTKNYVWTFYRQNFGLWSFQSHEKGIHINSNGEWKWQSLSHENISRIGMVIGGDVECTLNSSTTSVGMYWAGMELNYNIKTSVVCSGSPFTISSNFNSRKLFNVND